MLREEKEKAINKQIISFIENRKTPNQFWSFFNEFWKASLSLTSSNLRFPEESQHSFEKYHLDSYEMTNFMFINLVSCTNQIFSIYKAAEF
jgi:hypothetical protein